MQPSILGKQLKNGFIHILGPVHLRRPMADICVNQHKQPEGGITLAIKEKIKNFLNATVVKLQTPLMLGLPVL